MHELEALERAGWDALSGPDGAAFYQAHMADDGLMVFPGMILDKAGAVDAIRTAEPWSEYELEDLRVLESGEDAGVVIYRALARREGQAPYSALMSSVYGRRGDAWQLVLHQQTPEP